VEEGEESVKRERRKSDEVEEEEEGMWGESVIACVHSLIFMINFKVCVCVCIELSDSNSAG